MTATPPPASWIDPWPSGHIHPDAPRAAIWLAKLTSEMSREAAHPADIARATHLDIRTVRAVLDGTRWPTMHTVAALSDHLLRTAGTGPERHELSEAPPVR